MEFFKKSKNIYAIIIAVYFLSCAIFGTVGICPDTDTYLSLSPARDPLYGIFVHVFSFMEEPLQLWVIVLIQNILGAFSCIYLLFFLIRKFKINVFVQFLVTACLLIPHIMIPMSTVSGMVLLNTILSEGITLPLYLILFTLLLQFVFEKDNKKAVRYMLLALLLCVLLIAARGQLLSILVVFVIVSVYRFLVNGNKKMFIMVFVLAITGYAAKIVINNTYNLVSNGVFTGNTSQSATVAANALFAADLDKKVSFKDVSLDKVYEDIVSVIREEKMHYSYAPKDLKGFVSYYENAHDVIKFNLANDIIRDYVKEKGVTDSVRIEMECDKVFDLIYKEVYLSDAGACFDTYIKLAASGFIRTIGILHPILNLMFAVAYAVTVAMTVYLFIRGKKEGRISPSALVMTLVLIMIAGLVLSTALVTMCISRYVIYNMSVFYIAALLELCEIVAYWRKKDERISEISEE